MFRRFLVYTHSVHDGRDVYIIIVKGRVSSSRTQSVQRFVPDFLGGLFIEAQGELWLYISAIFRYFHGDMQEYVGLFRVFASFTAYDDTSVYGGTAILNHGPKRVDISVCLFVGQSPGLKVGY